MNIDIDDVMPKDQSDADSQYAANLHDELNKPHLRSRRSTRSAMKRSISAPSNDQNNHNKTINGLDMQNHKIIPSQIHNQHKNGMYLNGSNKIKKQHKIKKSSDMSKGMLKIDGEDVNDIEFCSKCGISKDSLKTKGTWSRHLHSKHTYYCKQCPSQFTTAATLAEHERSTHSMNGSKQKYKSKKSKSSKHKKQTILSKKSDDTPDYCSKCGRFRGETAKSHWNKHMQTDHKYPCPQCKYRFAHRKKYNEHIKQCHSMNDQHSVNTNSTNDTETKEDDDSIKDKKIKTQQIKIPKTKQNNIKHIDVEMKSDSNIIEKKRKYKNYQNEQQPRKRRK